MEVGRRLGVPLAGVGMPGHFLLRDKVDPTVFVDPFHGGRLLDDARLRAPCTAPGGAGGAFGPGLPRAGRPARRSWPGCWPTCKAIYSAQGDRDALRWVLGLRCARARASPRATPTSSPA